MADDDPGHLPFSGRLSESWARGRTSLTVAGGGAKAEEAAEGGERPISSS